MLPALHTQEAQLTLASAMVLEFLDPALCNISIVRMSDAEFEVTIACARVGKLSLKAMKIE